MFGWETDTKGAMERGKLWHGQAEKIPLQTAQAVMGSSSEDHCRKEHHTHG
jgi:hypothetical protein